MKEFWRQYNNLMKKGNQYAKDASGVNKQNMSKKAGDFFRNAQSNLK